MTKPEQRAIVAERIMGWTEGLSGHGEPRYFKSGVYGFQLEKRKWAPDVDLEQMGDLRARLEKLRVGYESGWDASEGAWALLKPWRLGVQNISVSGSTSEGAVLLDAAARLAKEMG